MPEATVPSPAPVRPPLWGVGLLTALLLLGLLTAPAAGARDGDFVHLWLGGRALWTQGPASIYDPNVHRALLEAAFQGDPRSELWADRNDRLGAFFYPPPTALVYALFGTQPVRLAATVHAILGVLGAAAAGWFIGQLSRLGTVLGIVLVLSTPALFHNHVLGQNGVWVLCLVAAGGWLLCRERDLWAGVLFAGLALKPSWLLAVGWLPFVMGRPRVVWGLVVGGLSLFAVTMAVPGVEAWNDWLRLLPELAMLDKAGDYPLHLQYSLWGLARRALGLGTAGDMVGAGLSVGVVVLTALPLRRKNVAPESKVALGLAAATLVNPHLHPYDVTGGLFAVAVLLAQPGTRRLGWALLLLHHGGQAMEGLRGSQWVLAPATVGLACTWAGLWLQLRRGWIQREVLA